MEYILANDPDVEPIKEPLAESYISVFSKSPVNTKTFNQLLLNCKGDDLEAFIFMDAFGDRKDALTFKDWVESADNLAVGLGELGLTSGDYVGVLSPNCRELVCSVAAMAFIGVIPVFLNFDLVSGEDLVDKINDCNIKAIIAVITRNELKKKDILNDIFGEISKGNEDPRMPTLRTLILSDDDSSTTEDSDEILRGSINFNILMKQRSNEEKKRVIELANKIKITDPLWVLLTSGSTGHPKYCLSSHMASMYGAGVMIPRYQIKQGDKYFNDRPMSWVGGALFMGACAIGHFTLVTIDTRHLTCQANPVTVLKILQEERVAFALLLPYILYDILQLDDSATSSDLSALKVVLTTGQRLDINMIEKFKAKTSANVTMGYGITEVNGAVSVIFPYGDFYKQHTTMGYPSEHSEVSIQNYIDKTVKRIMPVNTSGEICIRGPGLMTRYLNNPIATKEAIDKDGWYHTGDVGTMTPYGYITITGRLCQFIKRGTVVIQPAKIEAELMKHPGIHNVQVIGVPDPRLYEEVCACVIPKKGCTLTAGEMRQWCDSIFSGDNLDGLSSAPKYFIFLEKLPVKPNGKTDTLALKELAKEKFGLDYTGRYAEYYNSTHGILARIEYSF